MGGHKSLISDFNILEVTPFTRPLRYFWIYFHQNFNKFLEKYSRVFWSSFYLTWVSSSSLLVEVKKLWRIIYWNIEYKILYIRSFHFWFRRTVSEASRRRLIWWLIFTSIGWWRVTWWWLSLAWTWLSNRISSSFWSCPFSISCFSCFAIFLGFSCRPVLWNLTFELNERLVSHIIWAVNMAYW